MSEGLFENVYNPDVLSCLANLSSDEVFTPPSIANAILDMLPQEIFSNPDTRILEIIIEKWIHGIRKIKKCDLAV